MPAAAEVPEPVKKDGEDYPDGEHLDEIYFLKSCLGSSEVDEVEDLLMLDLTHDEIKAAFR